MAEQKTSGIGKHSRFRLVAVGVLSLVVLSLVVLVIAGIYFLPGFIESRARAFVAENFNRHLTIRKMDLDLFGLTARLEGVRLSNPGQETDFASFDQLYVELAPATFTEFSLVIKEIRLVNPAVHIVRGQDKRSNIRDIVAYFSKSGGSNQEKMRFSINNIQIENGTIRVEDEVRKKRLLIEELNVGIPFVANMPSEVDIFVRFGISARINKDKIELVGKSKPAFGKRSGTLGVRLDKLDLPTYLGYLPFDPGFKLKSGKFSTDLDIVFARRDGDRRPVYIQGNITLSSIWLTESDNRDVLKIPEMKIEVGKSDMASGEFNIEHIGLKNPQIFLDRDGKGKWNVERLLAAGNWPTGKAEQDGKKSSRQRAWAVGLKQLVVSDGQFRLVDRVSGIRLENSKWSTRLGVSWNRDEEGKNSLLVEGGVTLQSLHVFDPDNRDMFRIGTVAMDVGKSDILSGRIGIARIALNSPQVFLDRNGKGQWNFERLQDMGKQGAAKKTESVENKPVSSSLAKVIDLSQLIVRDGRFQFTDRVFAKPVNVEAKNIGLNVERLSLDLSGRNLSVDRIVSAGARVQVVHSMPELLERYRKESGGVMPQKTLDKAAEKTGFHYQVKHAGIRDWAFHFENRNVRRPVVTQVSQLEITVENLSDSMEKPVPLLMRAKVNAQGNATLKGNVTVSPFKADLDIDMRNIDIRFIQPYVDDYVNLSLRQADLSVKGTLAMKQAQDGKLHGNFRGGAAIGSLAAVDQLTGRPVISWKNLSLEEVAVNLNPLSVAIDKAKMNDVVARVILLQDGRLNLQNILCSKAGGQKSLTESEEDGLAIEVADKTATVVRPVPVKRSVTAASDPSGNDRFRLSIKRWIIGNGNVRFSDNFIKPHYTANIRDLRGAFVNLSNDPKTQSRLWLKGQVNGAPLVISGYVNPLSDKLTLNIKAQVRGMELAQFSAYTGKYLGYGIEKGKLSYKATYKVENGELKAENALVLDQLTLGEKVQSEEALDLSIELALDLLKDSDGVIDIHVPITGSLNDPEFSLGSIVGKVVFNTLKKVVTAPFAFLASLNENEKSLSGMIFEPGSSTLSKESELRLEKMAKGLAKRPGIKLEITGLYDEVADRAGLGEFVLQRKIRALKRRKLGMQSFEEVSISREEYPELIKEVYRNEKFDKPRKLLLFGQSLSVSEMEKLLVQHYASTKDGLILLANRRAEAVKNWLVLKGKLPDERIYLLASKKGEAGKDMPAHRVDFNLRWKS